MEVGAGIERVEAAHLILEVFRRAQVPWPLYDYEHLLPFEELQVDTKYILDQDSLPREVFQMWPPG